MSSGSTAGFWYRWLRRPQSLTLRKLLFHIHMYSALSVGLYVFFISVTGSVLVYRNELYVLATPEPYVSQSTAPLLDDDSLRAAALAEYPDSRVTRIRHFTNPEQAVEIWLQQEDSSIHRLFDPRTGKDVGTAVPHGIRMVTGLMGIHENLWAGDTGRMVNGIGGMAVLLLAVTGALIWWPGRKRWKRSVLLKPGVGGRRMVWDLHSITGFWSFAFICIFALSGIYLCFPDAVHNFAEWLQPSTRENAGRRLIDKFLYWLAFLHFGRIDGIGLPCDGPGVCDQSVKAIWALFGLVPAFMFVTGAAMWWNRVLRRWLKTTRQA